MLSAGDPGLVEHVDGQPGRWPIAAARSANTRGVSALPGSFASVARHVRALAEDTAALDGGLSLEAVWQADLDLLQPAPLIVVGLVRAAVEVREAHALSDDLRGNRCGDARRAWKNCQPRQMTLTGSQSGCGGDATQAIRRPLGRRALRRRASRGGFSIPGPSPA